ATAGEDAPARAYAEQPVDGVAGEQDAAVQAQLSFVADRFLQDAVDVIVSQSGAEMFRLIAGRELHDRADRQRRPARAFALLVEVVFDVQRRVAEAEDRLRTDDVRTVQREQRRRKTDLNPMP